METLKPVFISVITIEMHMEDEVDKEQLGIAIRDSQELEAVTIACGAAANMIREMFPNAKIYFSPVFPGSELKEIDD